MQDASFFNYELCYAESQKSEVSKALATLPESHNKVPDYNDHRHEFNTGTMYRVLRMVCGGYYRWLHQP